MQYCNYTLKWININTNYKSIVCSDFNEEKSNVLINPCNILKFKKSFTVFARKIVNM